MYLEIQNTSVLNQNDECMHEKCLYFSNLIRCPLRDPKNKISLSILTVKCLYFSNLIRCPLRDPKNKISLSILPVTTILLPKQCHNIRPNEIKRKDNKGRSSHHLKVP